MILFKSVLECKEYKSNNTGRVVGDIVIELEQTKNNISREAEDMLKSLMVNEHVVLLCSVLIRRYLEDMDVHLSCANVINSYEHDELKHRDCLNDI